MSFVGEMDLWSQSASSVTTRAIGVLTTEPPSHSATLSMRTDEILNAMLLLLLLLTGVAEGRSVSDTPLHHSLCRSRTLCDQTGLASTSN